MSIELEENYADGDWLVKHNVTGKIHSIHEKPEKALKKMKQLNDKDFNDNLDQGKDNGHTYESPYSAVSASKHYGKATNPYHESVELDEATKLPSDDKLTKDHLNMLDAEHEKHFNAYHKAKPMSDSSYKHAKKMDIISSQMDHVRDVLKNRSVGLHEDYSEKNPKIDLYHHEPGSEDHGKYLTSTKWSPTVKHAVAGYETKNPEMVGKVKGMKAKGCCESVVKMFESIVSGELNESKNITSDILASKIAQKLEERKIEVAQSLIR